MILQSLVNFILGIALGLSIDLISITIYNKIDPEHASRTKLIIVVLIQLMVVFTIFDSFTIIDDFMRIGLLSAQVFVFKYALNKLYPFKHFLKPH